MICSMHLFFCMKRSVVILDKLFPIYDYVNFANLLISFYANLSFYLLSLSHCHIQANIYHNNLSASTVFIAIDDGGRWKLGSFECAQKADNNRHWMQSDFVKTVKVDRFVPPEDEV
jgi:hypothetical protein